MPQGRAYVHSRSAHRNKIINLRLADPPSCNVIAAFVRGTMLFSWDPYERWTHCQSCLSAHRNDTYSTAESAQHRRSGILRCKWSSVCTRNFVRHFGETPFTCSIKGNIVRGGREMIKNIPETSKPRIWCPEEDYHSRNDGISMSTTSGSSSCGSSREIEAMACRDTRAKQQEHLFILQPSTMVIAGSKPSRYRFLSSTNQIFRFTGTNICSDLEPMCTPKYWDV